MIVDRSWSFFNIIIIQTVIIYNTMTLLYCRSDENHMYCPNSKPLVKGIYNNDPHTLIRFDTGGIDGDIGGEEKYILLLSQLNKKRDACYTMSIYSSSHPFRFHNSPGLPVNQVLYWVTVCGI